jgi:hypothetical protein
MHRGCPPGPLAQSACLVANLGAGLPPPLAREFSDRNTPPCLDQHRPLVDNDSDPGAGTELNSLLGGSFAIPRGRDEHIGPSQAQRAHFARQQQRQQQQQHTESQAPKGQHANERTRGRSRLSMSHKTRTRTSCPVSPRSHKRAVIQHVPTDGEFQKHTALQNV